MTHLDLIITPFYFILFSMLAYFIRPYVTTKETRKYFLLALWVRFFGAIALGFVYQFHYGGGDTFNYFTHGSKWIYEAFLNDPGTGIKLLFEPGGEYKTAETFSYSQHIWYYRDPKSYTIVKITAFFDLLTFHTYTATALFFATLSFGGLWALYSAVANKYLNYGKWLAIAILFVPSTIFWGSGILKDTVTIGALGWLTFACIYLIDLKRRALIYWIIALLSAYLIFSIKTYILICYVPVLVLWLYWKNIFEVRNTMVRIVTAPILLLFFGMIGYFALIQISSESDRYALDVLAERAAITAYDIRYGWGARIEGDGGYDLGVLDGTWQSMLQLMPSAINVSLFRPYLWEVRNPLMLLSALESLTVLLITVFMLLKGRWRDIIQDPFLIFCFFFAILFAFAVGVSTFNFGTLMRYKIPLLPFYLIIMSVLNYSYTNSKQQVT